MNAQPQAPLVVLVHGLWFGAWSLGPLARRLRQAGFEPRRFRYRSTRGDLAAHARALRRFVGDLGNQPLHFVAHSLGGLVTLRMLAEASDLPHGRVVLLGSPLGGSVAARRAARLPGARGLLGAARGALESGYAHLAENSEIGMIAGSRPIGLGLLVGGLGSPGDGTVAIAETRADGLCAHCLLPVTHTGMLFSKTVVREVVHFLQAGSFSAAP